MKFASVASTTQTPLAQVTDLCQEAESGLGGLRPDLVVVFLTSHFEEDAEAIVQALVRRYPTSVLIGTSAEGIIGGDHEFERVPAVSLFLAHLPGVRLEPFTLTVTDFERLQEPAQLPSRLGIDPARHPAFLLLADPFTFPVTSMLDLFNRAYPGRPLQGGMASGCERPGQAVLIADDQVHREGAVGVALSGAIEIQPIVSHGCRPIGGPFVITRCERHVVRELGGRQALTRLKEVIEHLSPADEQLAREALFVGRVINEYKESFTRGDFLIRSLLGIDPSSGAIAVGDELRVGATIQFHVRDQASADEDLQQMLASCTGDAAPAGVLLFSCNGRGTRMWSQPNHDVSAVHQACGRVPVAGFFAAGEFGPVGGRNFIHGHTASIAMLRPQ